MEAFTYKGITDGKYVEGDIEALNIDEASHLLKEKKIIITNIIKSKKKKADTNKKKSNFSLFNRKKKAKVEDVLIFSKQLKTLSKTFEKALKVVSVYQSVLKSFLINLTMSI